MSAIKEYLNGNKTWGELDKYVNHQDQKGHSDGLLYSQVGSTINQIRAFKKELGEIKVSTNKSDESNTTNNNPGTVI